MSLDFFEDVFVPYYNIFEPNRFDEDRRVWIWDDHLNDGDVGAEEPEDELALEIKKGDEIRFKVESVGFEGRAFSVKGMQMTITEETERARKRSMSFDKGLGFHEGGATSAIGEGGSCKMNVVGSIKEDGLGKPDWWEPEDTEGDDENDDDD